MKLQTSEVELHYDQSGSGPDIVWLAGGDMPGSSWHPFQLPDFADFRNLTYDARGVGQTQSLTEAPWPIHTHARDCIALIEHTCDAPVFLAGLSMGSCIAQEISLTRPDLVRAAVPSLHCQAAPDLHKKPESDQELIRLRELLSYSYFSLKKSWSACHQMSFSTNHLKGRNIQLMK